MDFKKICLPNMTEVGLTRKMLEAIPADADFSYKPHPKSMSWTSGRASHDFTRRMGP